MSAGGRERVLWSDDGQTMYFDGRPLRISEFCQFIHKIIDAAEKVLCEMLLFGDTKRLATMNLSELRDDFNVENIKHSFVSDPDNNLTGERKRMMDLLRDSGAWNKMMKVEADGLRFKAKG